MLNPIPVNNWKKICMLNPMEFFCMLNRNRAIFAKVVCSRQYKTRLSLGVPEISLDAAEPILDFFQELTNTASEN